MWLNRYAPRQKTKKAEADDESEEIHLAPSACVAQRLSGCQLHAWGMFIIDTREAYWWVFRTLEEISRRWKRFVGQKLAERVRNGTFRTVSPQHREQRCSPNRSLEYNFGRENYTIFSCYWVLVKKAFIDNNFIVGYFGVWVLAHFSVEDQ